MRYMTQIMLDKTQLPKANRYRARRLLWANLAKAALGGGHLKSIQKVIILCRQSMSLKQGNPYNSKEK